MKQWDNSYANPMELQMTKNWTHEFDPQVWRTRMINKLKPQEWRTRLTHENDPPVWSTNLTHEIDQRVWLTRTNHKNDPGTSGMLLPFMIARWRLTIILLHTGDLGCITVSNAKRTTFLSIVFTDTDERVWLIHKTDPRELPTKITHATRTI